MNGIVIGNKYRFIENDEYGTCMPLKYHGKICKVVVADGEWHGVASYIVHFEDSDIPYWVHYDELYIVETPYRLINSIKQIKML